jgi:hypothetical protein
MSLLSDLLDHLTHSLSYDKKDLTNTKLHLEKMKQMYAEFPNPASQRFIASMEKSISSLTQRIQDRERRLASLQAQVQTPPPSPAPAPAQSQPQSEPQPQTQPKSSQKLTMEQWANRYNGGVENIAKFNTWRKHNEFAGADLHTLAAEFGDHVWD